MIVRLPFVRRRGRDHGPVQRVRMGLPQGAAGAGHGRRGADAVRGAARGDELPAGGHDCRVRGQGDAVVVARALHGEGGVLNL